MDSISSPLLYTTNASFSLRTLLVDDRFHCRADGTSNAIALRQLLKEEGGTLDPLVVVLPHSDAEDWDPDRSPLPILIDGFDRYYAYAGYCESLDYQVPVEIWAVDDDADLERAALLLSLSTNVQNRLQKPRTRADKRKAVRILLEDVEWREYSDRAIAAYLRVSNSFVGNVRDELEEKLLIPPRSSFISQNGKTFHREPVDLGDRAQQLQEVQSVLATVPDEKQEQVIDLAWTLQQRSGGGLVEPATYREAIARLQDGREIDRTESGSYARARSESTLKRAIEGTWLFLEPDQRVRVIQELTERMSPDEIERAMEILAVRRQMSYCA